MLPATSRPRVRPANQGSTTIFVSAAWRPVSARSRYTPGATINPPSLLPSHVNRGPPWPRLPPSSLRTLRPARS